MSSLRREPAVMLGASSMELSIVMGLNFDHSKGASGEHGPRTTRKGRFRIIWRANPQLWNDLFPQPFPLEFYHRHFSPQDLPRAEAGRGPSRSRRFEPRHAMPSSLPADAHLHPPRARAAT